MKTKIVYYILAALIIMAVAFLAGLAGYHAGDRRGRAQAKQRCIDSVMENCEYICGVGADFYFPDQQSQEPDYEIDETVETMIALRKELYEK
jgi:hypothetical protein